MTTTPTTPGPARPASTGPAVPAEPPVPSEPAAPRRTSLYPVHAALGAGFTDFGGWEMPLRYGSDLAEHRAVRTSAGIFDLSHMGEVWVRGERAGSALDHALVGRVKGLAVGRARYTMLVTPTGHVVDDLIVYHVAPSAYLVVPNAGNAERVATALRERVRGFAVQVEDASATTALIAVQGPRAVEVLAGVVESGVAVEAALRPAPGAATGTGAASDGGQAGTNVAGPPAPSSGRGGPDPAGTSGDGSADVLCGRTILERLRYYAAVRATAGGHSVLLARTGYTGEDGFELFCCAEAAPDLWDCVTAAGARLEPTPVGEGETEDGRLPALTPCGLAARDSLRLEAGMALYGHELTEDTTPFDAGLGAVVALDKAAFVGREALMARSRREGEVGTSVLVALVGQGRRAARPGCPVIGPDGTVIGEVTSGLLSPTLGHPIALARVSPYQGTSGARTDVASADGGGGGAEVSRSPAWPVGTQLGVDVRGRVLPMTVVDAPFYRRAR